MVGEVYIDSAFVLETTRSASDVLRLVPSRTYRWPGFAGATRTEAGVEPGGKATYAGVEAPKSLSVPSMYCQFGLTKMLAADLVTAAIPVRRTTSSESLLPSFSAAL